jgi:hypothetical protein
MTTLGTSTCTCREYVQKVCALVLSISSIPSNDTTITFCFFHPSAKVDIPFFVNNFHPKIVVTLDRETYISTLTHSPCLSFGDYFVPKDFISGYNFFKNNVNTLNIIMFPHLYSL